VRTQRYKYIEYEGRRLPELFDLARDPKEMHNLMGTTRGKELLPGLKAMLEKLKRDGNHE
jgi:arylsulfatase A-like enzyme